MKDSPADSEQLSWVLDTAKSAASSAQKIWVLVGVLFLSGVLSGYLSAKNKHMDMPGSGWVCHTDLSHVDLRVRPQRSVELDGE